MPEAEASKKPVEKRNRERVVSLWADVCDHASAVARINDLVSLKRGGYVCFSTVHMVMESYDNPEYAARVNGADLIITDGMPLVWMQKLQGAKDAARVRANDLMIMLWAFA